jgi:hypothetical protein
MPEWQSQTPPPARAHASRNDTCHNIAAAAALQAVTESQRFVETGMFAQSRFSASRRVSAAAVFVALVSIVAGSAAALAALAPML